MNEEAIQANIDRIELELADMKAKLKESDKVVLEYVHNFYKINSVSIEHRYIKNNTTEPQLKHARYRDTEEQAEEALLRELQANRIEALARKLDANWKANWSDSSQDKWMIYYNHTAEEYIYDCAFTNQDIGTPYMSEQTAETICDYLNSGRYSLEMED